MINNFFKKKGVNNSNIKNELTHITLTKGILSIDKLKIKDTDSIKKWLYTIANNVYINHYKEQNNEILTFVDEFFEINQIDIEDNDIYISDKIKPLLNIEEYNLINKYYIEGYNFEELGKEYDKTPKAIKCKIYKIKNKLKEELV